MRQAQHLGAARPVELARFRLSALKNDLRRFKETEHLSMLKALVDAAEDIEAGRVYAWDDFKPRLARLRARAKRIAAK